MTIREGGGGDVVALDGEAVVMGGGGEAISTPSRGEVDAPGPPSTGGNMVPGAISDDFCPKDCGVLIKLSVPLASASKTSSLTLGLILSSSPNPTSPPLTVFITSCLVFFCEKWWSSTDIKLHTLPDVVIMVKRHHESDDSASETTQSHRHGQDPDDKPTTQVSWVPGPATYFSC